MQLKNDIERLGELGGDSLRVTLTAMAPLKAMAVIQHLDGCTEAGIRPEDMNKAAILLHDEPQGQLAHELSEKNYKRVQDLLVQCGFRVEAQDAPLDWDMD